MGVQCLFQWILEPFFIWKDDSHTKRIQLHFEIFCRQLGEFSKFVNLCIYYVTSALAFFPV
jgi:hypothetical protein